MDRRDFIKLTAVTGTSATLASCGNPEHQLIRFIPDDELVPGVAEWKPSVCPLCRGGCGLTVRVMEAEAEVVRNGQPGVVKIAAAKKLEGQPDHPINHGGLCPRGQAAIQITYHPDRLTQPMKRTGARFTGEMKPVSWDEAIGELVSRLDALAAANEQGRVAILTRAGRSRRHDLVAEFANRFGAPAPMAIELFGDEVLRRANAVSFGRGQLPTLDLARSRYVLGFGADFLGTWNSPVAQSFGYGEMRQGDPQVRGTFVQVEARMSQTGASADEWVPIRPGTEGVLALGLARVIIENKLRAADAAGPAGRTIEGWAGGLSQFAPEQVEQITGVTAKRIDRLAREFAARRPSVAIVGGAPLAHTNGLFTALAVNALNALVGSVGIEGGMNFMPPFDSVPGRLAQGGPFDTAPGRLAQGGQAAAGAAPAQLTAAHDTYATLTAARVLLLDGANPVFAAPKAWRVRERLEQIPFIASFGSFIDDTSGLADVILPDHSFLESWTDSLPEAGAGIAVANVTGPVMRPLHQTRATPDVVLEIAGKLKKPAALPWKTFEEMLKATMPEAAWSDIQKQGWTSSAGKPDARTPTPGARRPIPASAPPNSASPMPNPVRYTEPRFDGDVNTYPFYFLPYPSQAFFDGSLAHLPWLQELPDPLTSAMWSSWVELNPATAQKMSIGQGDLVDITSTQGTVRAPAVLSPGIAPDVIAMPVGQGHGTFTRYASARGVNPIAILAPITEAETGSLAWAATRVRIARAGDADRSLIMFAGEMRERPHEHEVR
jgi:menaquinone reductase, molybdopterin-binding-like subunit